MAALLQPDPTRRLAAHRALHHSYFASLPPRLRELPDGESLLHLCFIGSAFLRLRDGGRDAERWRPYCSRIPQEGWRRIERCTTPTSRRYRRDSGNCPMKCLSSQWRA
ncbi:hypothetical protein O0L34_g16727 [Tuta absoluta]|nr:hypothetical protein O0L34_g16727 [Tuta absoluta]